MTTTQPSPPRSEELRTRRAPKRIALASCLALGGGLLVAAGPASADTEHEVLAVDFSQSTGAVYGGATGVLYGLSDDDVPTEPVVAGAAPRTLTQMPEDGEQHPNGGALTVSDTAFDAGVEDIYINIQDYYPKWGYAVAEDPPNTYPGQADFLDKVRTVVERTARDADPEHLDRYVFTPFNEPDWIWYGNWEQSREQFFADWVAAYDLIHEIMPQARIAGLGESRYNHQRLEDFFTFAQANDVMPDIMTWHELGGGDLSRFDGHLTDFRALEDSLGMDELPINITEYSPFRRDTGVPGYMVRWVAAFEDAKVDAEMAYWTAAGNLSDHAAQTQGGNGAWWLLKWYGDLAGETVQVTPPQPDTEGELQGLGALDSDLRKGTVLFGGTDAPVTVDVDGLPTSVFGREVDIRVARTTFTGQEGLAEAPDVVWADRQRVGRDGGLQVDLPAGSDMDAYQLVITRAAGPEPEADAPWSQTTEAEDMQLSGGARAYTQSGGYATSGGRDVGSLGSPQAQLTWDVDVPEAGTYALDLYYGTGSNVPTDGASRTSGRHALYVDDELDQVVQYRSTLSYTYRGRQEVMVELPAGRSTLSLRTSADGGQTALPGSDMAMDKVTLSAADGPETSTYPATSARTTGSATVRPGDGDRLQLAPGATAEYFVAVDDDGYYDLHLDTAGSGRPASYDLTIDGRQVPGVQAQRASDGRTTATVHMGRGVHQVQVTATNRVAIDRLQLVRNIAADTNITTVQAEDPAVTLSSEARVEQAPQGAGSNVEGRYVGWLTAGETMTVPRPEGSEPGEYDIAVTYANADKFTGHPYNADIISRDMDITEEGASTSSTVAYQHTYSYYSFWTRTTPLTMTTESGDLVLGNPDGDAPNIDSVAIAPFVLDVSNTEH